MTMWLEAKTLTLLLFTLCHQPPSVNNLGPQPASVGCRIVSCSHAAFLHILGRAAVPAFRLTGSLTSVSERGCAYTCPFLES